MGQELNISKPARQAVSILGQMIRAARLQRNMTAEELATRTNVSRGVIQRIEAGELGTSIGAAFEAAVVLGIPLFDIPTNALGDRLKHQQEITALLPRRAFLASQSKPDNDF